MTPLRLTHTTALILCAVAEGHRHGFEIMEVAGLPSGTVYPALRRLEKEGVLSSSWEEAPGPGPRRRVYALTGAGQRVAAAAEGRLSGARRFLGGDGGLLGREPGRP